MEKKQTAVEWLIRELRQLAHNDKYHLGIGDIRLTQGMLDEFYKQAKQMEKEQIVDAIVQVMMKQLNICSESGIIQLVNNAEHYYNETYGGQDEN